MNTKILTLLSVVVVLVACAEKIQTAWPAKPALHVQPVYENGVAVACDHYYSVPLKNGGEFRYQWRPELEAFRATNGADLR